MRSTEKAWFSKECRRAGWVSALTNIAVFALLARVFQNVRSDGVLWLYPISAMSLGAIAVGTLNWRRWRSFRESLMACVYSVIALFQLCVLLLLPLALAIGAKGNLLIAVLILIFYLAIPLVIYVVLGFPILVAVACIGGSALYGLLMVMRWVGGGRYQPESREAHKPRPLQILV